jgi:A/G-specific adenine glycosylase
MPPGVVEAVRQALLDHYDRARRDLPWRHESDPYRIWVSEVMLQQTRVETVIPYYRRWLELFPDVATLAGAARDEVLLAWQGLGYYRRAVHLHVGARVVRDRHHGRVPDSYEALRGLPGIGAYTAGAVASIAFGRVVPAVDGNVKRVLARVFDEPAPTAAWLRKAAARLVDPRRPGDWNQALMELGATVCVPKAPACAACPLAGWCAARRGGTQEERPAPVRHRAVPTAEIAVAVVVDNGHRVLLVRRPEGGLLGGLWAFPETPVDGDVDPRGDEELDDRVTGASRRAAQEAGATLTGGDPPRPLPVVRHRFTHLDARYHPVLLAGSGADDENRRWVPLARRQRFALPVAQEKIASAAAAALADR